MLIIGILTNEWDAMCQLVGTMTCAVQIDSEPHIDGSDQLDAWDAPR